MRITRLSPGLILALSCICLQAQPPQQKITVTGKLGRIMAIGEQSFVAPRLGLDANGLKGVSATPCASLPGTPVHRVRVGVLLQPACAG